MSAGFTVMHVAAPEGASYTITGPDCQILNVTLKTGESVATEPGSMMYMSSDIKSSVACGSCSRLCVGEAICKSIYTNQGSADGFVALTPNFPAKIIPVDLSTIKGKLIAKSGAYMSSLGDVKTVANFDCNPLTCCFGGLGCARQEISGSGTAFLAAGGTILKKDLQANETIIVDHASVVGYEDSAIFGIKRAGGCCMCLCGGEGMFVNTLKGPGAVYMQSMSFEKYRQAVAPPVHHERPVNNIA
jgi:uncharacterized protein (AIM24 family)